MAKGVSITDDAPADRYFLMPHVYTCRVDEVLVFLDLRADTY